MKAQLNFATYLRFWLELRQVLANAIDKQIGAPKDSIEYCFFSDFNTILPLFFPSSETALGHLPSSGVAEVVQFQHKGRTRLGVNS